MFQVNQIVKYVQRNSDTIPMRVIRITPTGRIRVEYMCGAKHLFAFKPSSYSSNQKAYSIGDRLYGGYIEPLADGETAESILAANAAKHEQEKQESTNQEAEFQKNVTEWWTETGAAFWASRLAAGVLGDKQISSIRFADKHGEERVCLISIDEKQEPTFGGDRVELHCSGISKRDKYIGSFCMGTTSGKSLEECLYRLLH